MKRPHLTYVLATALHCARKGHDWHTEKPTRCVELVMCRWCGLYRGARVVKRDTCAWWRP